MSEVSAWPCFIRPTPERDGPWRPSSANSCYAFAGRSRYRQRLAIGLPATGVRASIGRYASSHERQLQRQTMAMGDPQLSRRRGVGGAAGRRVRRGKDRRAPCARTATRAVRLRRARSDGCPCDRRPHRLCLGSNSYSGIGNALWYHGRPTTNGELFYNGTFAPGAASTAPPGPAHGDVHQSGGRGPMTSGFNLRRRLCDFRRGGFRQDRLGRGPPPPPAR